MQIVKYPPNLHKPAGTPDLSLHCWHSQKLYSAIGGLMYVMLAFPGHTNLHLDEHAGQISRASSQISITYVYYQALYIINSYASDLYEIS